MMKLVGTKHHYKMYKRGRFWVVAGLTALTWELGGTLAAQADGNATATTADATSQTTASATTTKTVTLKTTTNSSAAVTKQSATSQTATSATSATSGSAASQASASSASAATSADAAVTATSQADTTKQSTTTGSQASASTSQATSSAATSATGATSENPETDTLSQSGTVGSTAEHTTVTSDAPVASSAATSVVTPTSVTNTVTTATTQSRLSLRANLMRTMATSATTDTTVVHGVNGDVTWTFDTTTGALVLSGGTLASPDFTYTDANGVEQTLKHGKNYQNQIITVTIQGELYITGANGVDLFNSVTSVTGLDKVDVSQATDLTRMFAFSKMATLDLDNWDVRNVTKLDDTFYQSEVTDLKVDQWQTDSLMETLETFAWLPNLQTLDVANWNMSHVINMGSIFSLSESLKNLDVSHWDVSNVTNFYRAFYDTFALTTLDVSDWNTSSAKNMYEMFEGAGVQVLDLSKWDFSQITNDGEMFGYAPNQVQFNLIKLTIGPTFKFIDPDPGGYNNIGQVTAFPYTGYWINATTGDVISYQDLDKQYLTTPSTTVVTYEAQTDDSDRSVLVGQDFNIYPGMTVDVTLGVKTLVNYEGVDIHSLDPSWFSYTGTVDTTQVGQYPITIHYDNGVTHLTTTVNVNVVAKTTSAELSGEDVTIVLGPDKNATLAAVASGEMRLVSGVDDTGNPINVTTGNLSDIVETYADGSPLGDDSPDLTQPLAMKFQFEYDTADGVRLMRTSYLSLVKTQAAINLVADPQVIIGPDADLDLTTYFSSVTDALGNPVTDASGVTFSGLDQVDVTKAGDYPITATYTDSVGNVVTAQTTIHVIPNNDQLVLTQPADLIAGPDTKFDPSSVMITAVNTLGEAMTTANGLTIDSQVDPQKAGTYLVTVSYQDESGNRLTKSVTVTVLDSQAKIATQPVTVMVGQTFQATTGVVSAKDARGQTVSAADLTYDTSQVDLTQAGTYPVNVSYTDAAGNVVTSTFQVTVTKSPIAIQTVAQVNLRLGKTFDPTTAVQSATGSDGQALAKTALTYDLSQVDLTKAGSYTMWVSYQDQYQNTVRQAVKVTVSALSLVVTPTASIQQGMTLDLASLIKSATDGLGQPVKASQLTYKTTGDPTTPGTYQLTITNRDQFGNQVTQTVTVTVLAATTPVTPTDPTDPVEPATPTEPSAPTTDTPADPGTKPTTTPTSVTKPTKPTKRPGKPTKVITKAGDKTNTPVTTVTIATKPTDTVKTASLTGTTDSATAMTALVSTPDQLQSLQASTKSAKATSATQLPQTNETQPKRATTLWVAITAGLALFGLARKRRD
ncbi:BspA family leucine-rich repeat surface protein [Lactiplantibacillus daowaiensis]|uniref:BspA family leucine-rich repeat surface protein n=1 Tax=Lactiplantibacillus daowaiensis TaxID=2559918 RepID=A0ABW1RXD7_9LACO|nr:BspA family leucine-rich repeat surface protein [Lactiplantibacillus daowaiensis]